MKKLNTERGKSGKAMLLPGTHLQIGLHQVPPQEHPQRSFARSHRECNDSCFFSFHSCILPQIFLDCFSFAILSVQITGSSEKELEEGLECNI